MTILITGGNGRLGKELVKLYPDSLHPSHQNFDLTNAIVVSKFIKENQPDMVLHCAALTSVRRCEDERELCFKTNVGATENLVRACELLENGCYFVYLSTACVFQGDIGNYTETDLPYPKNFYGLTKLLGEYVTKRSGLEWLIIRTNFVPRELWPYPQAFTDRYGTYLFADELASRIKSITNRKTTGILHVCGSRKMSMYEIAKETTPGVLPTTLSDYSGPPLTKDMSLRSIRIATNDLTEKGNPPILP